MYIHFASLLSPILWRFCIVHVCSWKLLPPTLAQKKKIFFPFSTLSIAMTGLFFLLHGMCTVLQIYPAKAPEDRVRVYFESLVNAIQWDGRGEDNTWIKATKIKIKNKDSDCLMTSFAGCVYFMFYFYLLFAWLKSGLEKLQGISCFSFDNYDTTHDFRCGETVLVWGV